MRRIAGCALLFALAVGLGIGQDSDDVPLRNSDVVQMTKSGLGKFSIELLIGQGSCSFDVSPQALAELTKAGVDQDVIDAMVAATPVRPPSPVTPPAPELPPVPAKPRPITRPAPERPLVPVTTLTPVTPPALVMPLITPLAPVALPAIERPPMSVKTLTPVTPPELVIPLILATPLAPVALPAIERPPMSVRTLTPVTPPALVMPLTVATPLAPVALPALEGPPALATPTPPAVPLIPAEPPVPVTPPTVTPSAPATPPTPATPQMLGDPLFHKALDAIGPQDELKKIHAIQWTGIVVETAGGNKETFAEERIQVYPESVAVGLRSDAGFMENIVVTPDFSYQDSDQMMRTVSAAKLDEYRGQARLDPVNVAQHAGEYVVAAEGGKDVNGEAVDVLKMSWNGAEGNWTIDAETGELLSAEYETKPGEVKTEFSNYRIVGEVNLPFKWITRQPGRTTEVTVSKYALNPDVDEGLFKAPDGLSSSQLNLKVLQTETVPHAQEIEGNVATSCQISRESKPAAELGLDDVPLANGVGTPTLRMVCNAWDTTQFWPRKLNAMLVAASDGNAYIIACDEALRWSKCVPLDEGRVFKATRVESNFEVQGLNIKGKDQEGSYLILQTQPLP